MAHFSRFHILIGMKRTTVSLDTVLASLLGLHLGGSIEHASVRQWCQAQVDNDLAAFAADVSQRLARLAVLEVARKELAAKYWDLALDNKISSRKRRRWATRA